MSKTTDPTIDPRSLIDPVFEFIRNKLKTPRHTTEFYETLQSTLRNPLLTSCAYFGFGDYAVLQLLAAEQDRRSTETNLTKEEVFPFSVHCELSLSEPEWGLFEPSFTRGILKNPSIFINDWPRPDAAATFLQIRRSTTQIVFSSCPQSLMIAADANTIDRGYFIYTANGRSLF
jgi:hypothetical protein